METVLYYVTRVVCYNVEAHVGTKRHKETGTTKTKQANVRSPINGLCPMVNNTMTGG